MKILNEFSRRAIQNALKEDNIYAILYNEEKYPEGCGLFIDYDNIIIPMWIPLLKKTNKMGIVKKGVLDAELLVRNMKSEIQRRKARYENYHSMDKVVDQKVRGSVSRDFTNIIADQIDFFHAYGLLENEVKVKEISAIKTMLYRGLDKNITLREAYEEVLEYLEVDLKKIVQNLNNYQMK